VSHVPETRAKKSRPLVAAGGRDGLSPKLQGSTSSEIQDMLKGSISREDFSLFMSRRITESSIDDLRRLLEIRGDLYSIDGETAQNKSSNDYQRKRLFDMAMIAIYEELLTPAKIISIVGSLEVQGAANLLEKMAMLEYGMFYLDRDISSSSTTGSSPLYIHDSLPSVFYSTPGRNGYKNLANVEEELQSVYDDSSSAVTGLQAILATGTAAVTLTSGTTASMLAGQTLSKTSGTGAFASSATVASITGPTTFTMSANHSTAGSITFQTSAIPTVLSLIPGFDYKSLVRINGREAECEGEDIGKYKYLLNYNSASSALDRNLLRKYWAVSGEGYYLRDGRRVYLGGLTTGTGGAENYSYYSLLGNTYNPNHRAARNFLVGLWNDTASRTIHY
jgi:hypothetical protein